MPLAQGQVLNNRYRIVNLLGQGGYGAVYRAWDITLSHRCALKENLETSEEARSQFEQEAIVLAGLRHPNLPRVTDHFFIPGEGQYLVMDYIEGRELTDIITDERTFVSETQVLGWIDQVCSALEYLHGQTPSVIHRDVKPQNIIIDEDDHAILVDFGIFKLFDSQVSTAKGARGVTPGYSPPEQYGRGRTDARSDEYSVGATLYYALTGVDPVDAIERLVHHQPMLRPSELNPSISPPTEKSILKAMQLESNDRYQTIAALRDALSNPSISVQPQAFPQPQAWPSVAATPAQPASKPAFDPSYKSTPSYAGPAPVFQPKPAIKPLPTGVKATAWYCIISGALMLISGFILLLGILGGAFLLQKKKSGWWLSQIYLGLGAITALIGIGVAFFAGFEISTDEASVFMMMCSIALLAVSFILMVAGMIYLTKKDVRSLFT